MQRGASNWWVLILWIPLFALVLGLIAGCASIDTGVVTAASQPTRAELRRLVAQELDADSRFDSFGASESTDARTIAAVFRPVLADVNALACRIAPAASLDCTLEVVLRFPAMDGRESRTYWERRLRLEPGGWRLVGQAQP
jgi:hypothetical protein